MIQTFPEERPSFEEIYRNKWVNENFEEVLLAINLFTEGEEDTLIKELIKSDFIIEKENEIHNSEKQRTKFSFIE